MKIIFIFCLILTSINKLLAVDEFKEVAPDIGVNHLYISALLDGGGCCFFDYDNDGFLDLYATCGLLGDKLFHNNGNGTFTDVSKKAGIHQSNTVATEGVATADINNDGFEDIYVCTYEGGSDILYKNKGDGTFEDISEKSGITSVVKWATSVTFGDFNLDGWVDIYVGTNGANTQHVDYAVNYLLINNKNETFTEKTLDYKIHGNGYTLSVVATDTDNDNDIDIMVANDFGYSGQPDVLYRNDYPSASFTDISKSAGVDAGINGMGIGAGDYDEDGDMDYYVTNIGKNFLYRNDGNNKFTNVAAQAGVEYGFVQSQKTTTWSPVFFDFDNDTYLDLFITAGYIGEPNTAFQDPNKLFHNNGDGTFEDVTDKYNMGDVSKSHGCSIADIDNDGFMDLFVVNLENDFEIKNHSRLYLNKMKSANNNWFKVKLQGTTSNRSAVGAKIKIYAGGRMFLREIDGGCGHMCQNSKIAHCGLGKISKVDSVKVIWPGGFTEKYGTFMPNQQITIIEKTKAFVSNSTSITLCEGESYQGQQYFVNSKVDLNYKSFYGYDSIVKTNIIVNPKYDFKLDKWLCKGQSFNGIKPTKDTVINLKLKTVTGCDSLITAKIFVFSPTSSKETLKFCDNGIYDGKTYNSSTTITKTTTNYNGCDSLITIYIEVLKSASGNANISLCEGEKYKDIEYFQDKTITEHYPSYNGCDSNVTLKISVLPIIKFSKDTTILCGQKYNGVQYDTPTQVKFENKIVKGASNGCDSIFTVFLYVKDPMSVFEDNIYNFELSASPNPLLSTTEIKFFLPSDGQATLALYSNTGEKVMEVTNDNLSSGNHSKIINLKSMGIARGIYICRVSQGNKYQDIKIIYAE